MAFCPYCGKQLQNGEICSCVKPADPSSITETTPDFFSSVPIAPAPAAPDGAYRVSADTPPAPNGADPNAPSGDYAPRDEYQPRTRHSAPDDMRPGGDGYAPRSERPAPTGERQSAVEHPPAPVSETDHAPFSSMFTALIERVKLLLSADAVKSTRAAAKATDLSWIIVLAAFVVLGALTAAFGICRFAYDLFASAFGGFVSLSDFMSNFFGYFGRALLVNILIVGADFGVLMLAMLLGKKKIPLMGALNLVGLSLVPAVAFTALGFIFSFFFPVGSMLCAVVSAVCTLVILNAGISAHCQGSASIWRPVIVTLMIVFSSMLVIYIIMSASIQDAFGKVMF